jgi:hypothetical protein
VADWQDHHQPNRSNPINDPPIAMFNGHAWSAPASDGVCRAPTNARSGYSFFFVAISCSPAPVTAPTVDDDAGLTCAANCQNTSGGRVCRC